MPYQPLNPMQLYLLQIAERQGNADAYRQMFQQQNYISPADYTAQLEASLPSYLQIGPQLGQSERAAAQSKFVRDNQPTVAESRAREQQFGGAGNTFATQRTAQLEAEVARQAADVGTEAENSAVNKTIALRNAYFGQPGSNYSSEDTMMMKDNNARYTPAMKAAGAEPSKFSNYVNMARGVDNLFGNAFSNTAQRVGNAVGNGMQNLFFGNSNPVAQNQNQGSNWGNSYSQSRF